MDLGEERGVYWGRGGTGRSGRKISSGRDGVYE